MFSRVLRIRTITTEGSIGEKQVKVLTIKGKAPNVYSITIDGEKLSLHVILNPVNRG